MSTAINEITVKSLNKELADLIDGFCQKHGFGKGKQAIKYAMDGSTMTLTVVMGAKDKTSGINPVWYRHGARHGYRFGLDAKDIGLEFKYGSKGIVKYVGMSSPKFAIYQTADGRYWKADPEVLANMIKASKALAKA